MITEVGCPVSVSGSQIESPIAEVRHWAEHGRNFDYLVDTGIHETQLGPARRKIQYDPVGVVGAITPWNVPFYLNIAETVPALMAGNTVVLKPAQLTPWSGTELGRIIAEKTDIPAGVFNVVTSNANEVGAALSADPRVDMITFTGSTATGRAILAAGAADGQEDPARARRQVDAHRLRRRGFQRLPADGGDVRLRHVRPELHPVEPSPVAAQPLCRRPRNPQDHDGELPGRRPVDPGHHAGPADQCRPSGEKTLGLIQSGIADGATLITGGGIPENLPIGYYVQPTLLSDVDPTSTIAQTEIFGPVITVTPVRHRRRGHRDRQQHHLRAVRRRHQR